MVVTCIVVCWMLQKLLIVYIMENSSEYYCQICLPILIISYLRHSVCVMWDSCKSEYFKMYNGVKQSGVISCHLFNLYIDPLLVQLSNSGYGCHIHVVYAGALSYADDITLLCPSIWGLNEMFFNSKKTVCIKFGSAVIERESAFLTV